MGVLGKVIWVYLGFAGLPDLTEEAETLKPGLMSFDFGVNYRDHPVDFGIEDRKSQIEFGKTQFRFGLGRVVELQITGVAVNFIENLDRGTNANSGDWEFGTKVWLLQENNKRPGMSFFYSVKIPNGSNEEGGATDETDFNTFFLFDKSLNEQWICHLNLGLGILGDPFTNSSQNDVFTYGLSIKHQPNDHSRYALDFGGQTGPEVKDDQRALLLSYSHKLGIGVLYGAVGAGLGNDNDRWRIHIGWRRHFKIFEPDDRERFYRW